MPEGRAKHVRWVALCAWCHTDVADPAAHEGCDVLIALAWGSGQPNRTFRYTIDAEIET
jgi:hypothetical protein